MAFWPYRKRYSRSESCIRRVRPLNSIASIYRDIAKKLYPSDDVIVYAFPA